MKKILLVIMSLVMSLALFACGAKSNQTDPQVAELQKQLADLQQQVQNQQNQPVQNNQAQTNQSVQQNNQMQNNGFANQTANVSMDQAKQIATQNAGFDVNSVTFIKTIQDYDDFYLKWEIDFVANNMKYEYDISATDGTILKAEREGVAYQGGGYIPPANANQQAAQGNVGAQQGMQGNVGGQQAGGNFGGVQANGQGIDVEQAKQIATGHAGFNTSNVTFTKQKYDFDDGIAKWEIEFVVNTNKYEVEVSASNGAIVKYQVESIYND